MFRTIQVHVAVAKENEIRHLALRRSETCKLFPTMWQTITGTLELNENAFDAARRELKEESGLITDVWYKLPFLGGFYDLKRDTVESVPTFAVVFEDFRDIILSEEHTEYNWLKNSELEQFFPIPDHINGALQLEKMLRNPEQLRIFSL
jgi:dihydroneopterin triphosphate diphosphatase